MIVARIMGGLGNQLFGYAAARRLALASNVELVIDDVSGFTYDQKYRRSYQLNYFMIPCRKATAAERLEPLSRVRRYVKRRWNRRLPFEQRRYIQQEVLDFDPRLLSVVPNGTVYLEGYWQSEHYFKDVENTIRSDLQIKTPSDLDNQELADQIGKCTSVAVHVRFFEAPNNSSLSNAPSDYYRRAIDKIEKRISCPHYYLFSDQPDAAREVIPLPNSRITPVIHNRGDEHAYADLWLMKQCQHFIIANSTFSWWGAWLSNNANKMVIAPGFELREGVAWWGFDGLIPEEWFKC